ncbi:hypothetical protein [Streptomyces enissocaesilis]|uniref:Uncharacterized protein n=1 Tax=Streptomyces enissocaesilis TaxID=332589 RepID=A0ABN3WMH2_9ACTN
MKTPALRRPAPHRPASRRLAPAVTAAVLPAAPTTGCSSTDPAPAEDGRPTAERPAGPAGTVLPEAPG